MPFFSFILKRYKSHAAAAELDELPPARPLSIEMMPLSTTSYLPITPKPIPQLEVSISSSTSYAMFEHISTARMKLSTNSFISNDAFEDIDLATPTNFAEPHKQLKSTTASPFDDQHEVDNSLAVSSSLSHIMDDDNDLHAASCKQLGRVASPFGDEHGLESEPSVEYAPTTHSSVHDYTERAMEYQRVSLLFGHHSLESHNLQRDHTLALLEGTKPQPTTPLDPELVEILALKMGRRQQEQDY